MRKIVVLLLLALFALATPVSAGQTCEGGVSVFTNGTTWQVAPYFGDLVGFRESKVMLGLNPMISANDTKDVGTPFAGYTQPNPRPSVPLYNCNTVLLKRFRFVKIQMFLGYPGTVDYRRINWNAALKTSECEVKCGENVCIDNCGNAMADLDAQGVGTRVFEIRSVNTQGKKQVYLNLVFVKWTEAYGRTSTPEKIMIPIDIVDPKLFLDDMAERLTDGAITSYDKLDDYGKRVVETGFIQKKMAGWELYSPGADYDTLEYNYKNRMDVAAGQSEYTGWQQGPAPSAPQQPMTPSPTPTEDAPRTLQAVSQPPSAPTAPATMPVPFPYSAPEPQPKAQLVSNVSNTTTPAQVDPNRIAFSFTVLKNGKTYNGQDIALRFYGAKELAGMSTDGKIHVHADRSDIGQDQRYMVYQNGKAVGEWQWFKIQGDGDAFNLNLVTAQEVAAR